MERTSAEGSAHFAAAASVTSRLQYLGSAAYGSGSVSEVMYTVAAPLADAPRTKVAICVVDAAYTICAKRLVG